MVILFLAFSCLPHSVAARDTALPKAFGDSGHHHVPRLARANGVADGPRHSPSLNEGDLVKLESICQSHI